MPKRNSFLQQLERRRQTHFKNAPSHVDGPSEQTMEQLETELKRAELEKTRAEINYWQDRREANSTASGDEPVFGLASNNQRRRRFNLPRKRSPQWK